MVTKEMLEDFKATLLESDQKFYEINKKLVETLQTCLTELSPIIESIKESNLLFTHPDIRIETDLGIILDEKDNSFFVYNGSSTIKCVDKSSGKPTNQSFDDFVKTCNTHNVLKGIEHINNFIPNYMTNRNSEIESQTIFLNNLNLLINNYKFN